MKKIFCNVILFCSILLLIASCGNSGYKFTLDAKGLENIEKELKSKFGSDSYYNEINAIKIGDKKEPRTLIVAKVSKDPNSAKLQEWVYDYNGKWEQKKELNLEIEGGNPKDYLFQLDSKYDLKKVGRLLEESLKKVEEERNLQNLIGFSASITPIKHKTIEQAMIIINISPEDAQKRFGFAYNLDGELVESDY